MLFHTIQHIKLHDELEQKIFYESTAITLGAALVLSVSYELLEKIQLTSEQPEVGLVIVMISLIFIAAPFGLAAPKLDTILIPVSLHFFRIGRI